MPDSPKSWQTVHVSFPHSGLFFSITNKLSALWLKVLKINKLIPQVPQEESDSSWAKGGFQFRGRHLLRAEFTGQEACPQVRGSAGQSLPRCEKATLRVPSLHSGMNSPLKWVLSNACEAPPCLGPLCQRPLRCGLLVTRVLFLPRFHSYLV